jgi:hypothetical protein
VNTTKLLIALIAFALLATACGGDDAEPTTTAPLTTLASVETTAGDTTAPSTTTPGTTTTAIDLPPSPLNGMGVEDAAALDRRAIAVKIDNHWNARPQSGIEQADAVYELLVEGGLTRFIALFHHSDTEYLGPIRSGRPTDPTLVRYIGAPLQISGAQPWVSGIIAGYGVDILGESGNTTFRIRTRSAPHNLYGSTLLMRDEADRRGFPDDPPPEPIFDFGEPTPGAAGATMVNLDWSNLPMVRWEWTGVEYVRFNGDTPHNWLALPEEAEDSEETEDTDDTGTSDSDENATTTTEPEDLEHQIATDVLVVITAPKYWASSSSGAGSSVPALDTVGSGDAYVFYQGKVVEGTWARESAEERFELTLEDGSPITIPAGRLWISIFPNNQRVTWQ